MNIYRSIEAFQKARIQKSVITFGSFDGVHLGHAFIFKRMAAYAQSIGGKTVVTTFHPHPRQVIYPDDRSMKLLTPIDEKIELLHKHHIDHLVIIPFSIEFSQLSPNEYIESFIERYYNPHTIMIGYDHRFGLNRSGDINTLLPYQEKGHYLVDDLPQKNIDDMKISSTLVREAPAHHAEEGADGRLGDPSVDTGRGIHGDKRGAQGGLRTANVQVAEQEMLVPANGI